MFRALSADWHGRFRWVVAEIAERRTGTKGSWYWQTLLASGPPRAGFKFIRALWMYRADEKTVYIHLADDADPAGLHWSVLWKADSAIAFRGATGASVSGLTIAHSFTGVAFLDESRQCSVSACTIGPWERTGVRLGSGAAGCLVEKNEIFRGAYEDWTPVDGRLQRRRRWRQALAGRSAEGHALALCREASTWPGPPSPPREPCHRRRAGPLDVPA